MSIEQTLDPVERLLIERECERLIYSYCHVIDHGDAARVAELFTEDGVWASTEVTREGRAAIAAAFQARQANTARMSRHVCSTPLIEVTDANKARSVTYLTLFRHDGAAGRRSSPLKGLPELVGEYRDEFGRTPEGWRFQRREVVVAFVQRKSGADGR
jgi:ketosteroid isomerase-like protein